MNKSQAIEHFKLYAEHLSNLSRPLQSAEIRKYQTLAHEVCELDRAENQLSILQQQFSLLKMKANLEALKQKALAAG